MRQHLLTIFFFGMLLLVSQNGFSQAKKSEKDSVKVYKDIYDYSRKSKFNKFIYKLLFKSSKINDTNKPVKTLIKSSNIQENKDKIIRNIIIESLDPFGYSIDDSLKKPNKRYEHFGNKIHINTKDFTLKNLLLFKKNQALDPLLIQESERLIRSQRYVRRVKIEAIPIGNSPDSVDIVVKSLDTWSIIPNGNLSNSVMEAKITERNLIGLGHQLSVCNKNRYDDKEKAVEAQ